MTPYQIIQAGNSILAAKIKEQGYFVTLEQVKEIILTDRFCPVLVRCNGGRFVCAAQYVSHFCNVVEESKMDYVRDISVTN